LRGILSQITGVSSENLDNEEPFESYGIDSIMITQINQPPFMSTPQNPLMDANNNGISNEPVGLIL
jgi:Phosphopantetheine attachment site.